MMVVSFTTYAQIVEVEKPDETLLRYGLKKRLWYDGSEVLQLTFRSEEWKYYNEYGHIIFHSIEELGEYSGYLKQMIDMDTENQIKYVSNEYTLIRYPETPKSICVTTPDGKFFFMRKKWIYDLDKFTQSYSW